MQDLQQNGKLRPLAQHGQPHEQQIFQRREPPHLLTQHRADAVEDQFPFAQETVEISIEEVGDGLRHDFQGQRIARIAGHQALPGGRPTAESLVGEQDTGALFVHPQQAQRAHRGASAFQRFDLPRPLPGGQQHTAVVGRLGQAPDESSVALVARQVAALAVPALE